ARELTDQWSIREVERRTPLILGQRHVDASGPASVEVELRVRVERLVVAAVDTNREYVGDPVVQTDARRVVGYELIIEGEAIKRLQLQTVHPQHEDLLNGEERLFDVTSCFLV